MKIVFLDAGSLYQHPPLEPLLSKYGEVSLFDHTPTDLVVERIKEADIVLTNKVVLNDAIFAKCPKLRLICVTATGTNNIDLIAAEQRGITVKNASNYSTNSVAQTTFALALHLLMHLNEHQWFVEEEYAAHRFFTHLSPSFSEIKDKTWGIVGLGNIGKQVAKIAEAFGAKVIYHSPSGHAQDVPYTHLGLEDLFKTSDFISIHSPLNAHTQNLIGASQLAVCKPNALLINVARGGIVDEAALASALNEGKLAGAGVDVFSVEPIKADNPLLHLHDKNKIVMTPHIAWGSMEARTKLMEIVCQNIEDFLKNN
jgi:lactate dehydrogenase-like 2-hydroxyacid dehydrogenase